MATSAAETTTTLDQVVSDIHILDIVEIFEHQNVLKDVCKHLGLDTTDINNAKSVPYTSKKHAEDMLHLWYSRNGKDATIGTFIKAAEKVPKAKASLDKLKSRWNIDGPPKHRKRKRKRTEETIPVDPQTSQDTVVAVDSEEPMDEILAESQNDPTPQNAAASQTLTNITNVVDNGQISSSHPQHMEAGTSMGGKENLKAGHVGVNSDTGMKEEKPCHMPSRVEVGEEIPGLPKGEDALPHMDYNKLIIDIIEHLEDDERLYRRVKFLCRSGLGTSHGIPYKRLTDCKPETFIDVLCQCQLLSPYDMDFLYHLMTNCEQTDFIKRIDDYCKFHEDDPLEIHKPNGIIAEGKVIVEVALNGHINQRSNRDTDRYKETFKRRFGIPKSATNFIGVGIGCVVLVFQLPLRWPCEQPGGIGDIDVLARLTDDVLQRADWLMDSDVIGIHIEGQEYVDFTGVSPIELHDITEESLLSSLDDGDVCDDDGDDDIQESFTDKQTTIPNDPKLLENSSVLSTVESTYLKAKPEQQQTTQNITKASSVKAKPGQQQQHTQNITEGSSVKEPRRNPLTEPRIPTRHLDALLQYGDVWKATIRHERKILRENVDPTEVTVYFPYLSSRVDEKVRAIQASQGRTRAMDVFIDDGLLYIGDQNWPNDLCYALGKVNQSFVAEQLKHKFLELLKKQEDTKYRKLAHYIRNEKPDWSTNFGAVLSTERRK